MGRLRGDAHAGAARAAVDGGATGTPVASHCSSSATQLH